LIEATLRGHVAADVEVVSIERWEVEQGYSGAELGYYDVAYSYAGSVRKIKLVTKEASLVERKTLARLGAQGLAVPFSYSTALTTDADALVCMKYVGEVFQAENREREVVKALAAIHFANLERRGELDWLPFADGEYIEQWTIQSCWRNGWQSLLGGGEFIDGYGQNWGAPKAGRDFAAEFAEFTEPLEKAAENMLATIRQLWDEGDSLTLIHADLHHDHVHWDGKRPYLIDWGQVRYGPFYLDLPNYFTREEALGYRAALEGLGYRIPEEKFLAYYDAVRPYPGFKYFGIGLGNWCFGDPPHQSEYVLHFIDMIVK
jgi:hypothetical protein